MREHDTLFIGGEWVAPSTSNTITVISPHTEEPVGRVPDSSTDDVDRAVAAARNTFDNTDWATRDPGERIAILQKFNELYATKIGEMAELISLEMGSPMSFSTLAQSPAPWMLLNTTINLAQQIQWEERRPGMLGGEVIVRREPVGVVGAIVPWNVPQLVTISKLGPALLIGNTVVLKPSPETPLDAYLMAEIFAEAGLPPGVLNIVPGGREIGEYLVTHPGVDKIAFTGSTAAGRRIASLCGEQLKRVSLELGGKSAAIILDDADLPSLLPGLKFAMTMNSGQACVAQTRVLASRERYDEVVDVLAGIFRDLKVGDPMDQANDIGPLVAERQQERVEKYIALGQEEGAKVIVGGSGRPEGLDKGWYVQPTLFANVDNSMRIAQEVIFGPVVAVIPYDDEADAVRIANDSEYGLAGSVWTSDIEHGVDIARRVRSGTYAVNQYTMDFGAPFGGYKASGLGREFGPESLNEYLQLKSIAPPVVYG
jgi:betaine-aldehyde dehydrogenase